MRRWRTLMLGEEVSSRIRCCPSLAIEPEQKQRHALLPTSQPPTSPLPTPRRGFWTRYLDTFIPAIIRLINDRLHCSVVVLIHSYTY